MTFICLLLSLENKIAASVSVASGAKIVAGPVLATRKNNYLLPFMLHLEGRKVSWVHSLSAKLLRGR